MPYYTLASLARASQSSKDTILVAPRESEDVFREVYRGSKPRQFTLEDTETVRISSLYRILRYILRSLGQLSRDESLSDKLREIYRSSGAPLLMSGAIDPSIRGALSIKKALECIKRPSLVPLSGASNELQVLSRIYYIAAKELGLDQAIVSLFTDPEHCWDALPTASDVTDYEMELMESVYETLIQEGITGARKKLQISFNMGTSEAYEIVSTARYVISQSIDIDQETERKIQSDRLERMSASARESLDTRMELASMKERNRLLGLTDRPPKDTTKEIMDVIANVSSQTVDVYEPDYSEDDE